MQEGGGWERKEGATNGEAEAALLLLCGSGAAARREGHAGTLFQARWEIGGMDVEAAPARSLLRRRRLF